VDRNWSNVPKALWPALNRLADAVDTALNWRTDGSLVVQVQGGSMYGAVTYPEPIMGMVLGGTDPYSWARVTPDEAGVWYVDSAQPLYGQRTGQVVAILNTASYDSGTGLITFETKKDIQTAGVTAGTTVKVRGVNPSSYNGDYTVVTCTGQNFTATASDPGTYAFGGGACFDVTAATAFRPAYEENDNATVGVGKIVRIEQRILTTIDGEDVEYEYRFPYCCTPGGNTTLIETTVSMSLNSRQNNFTTTNYTAYLLTAQANFSITGFGNGVCGKVIELINSGSNNNTITVESNSTQSSAANQYGGANGASDVIGPQSSATYFYDCVRQKWIKKAGSGTASGGGVIDLTGSASDPPAQLLYEATSPAGLDGWISVAQTTAQALTVIFEWVDYLGNVTTNAGVSTGGGNIVLLANMGMPAATAVSNTSIRVGRGLITTFRIYGQTANLGTPAPYRILGRMV